MATQLAPRACCVKRTGCAGGPTGRRIERPLFVVDLSRLRSRVMGLACVMVVAASGRGRAHRTGTSGCERGFDKRAWHGSYAERQEQSDLLVTCKRVLGGLTPEAVRALLGVPHRRPEPAIWWYCTGLVRDWASTRRSSR